MSKQIISTTQIAQSIHLLRGQKVLLDFDLAVLYGVETRVLNQAVKRSASRFPADFMCQISAEEAERISQSVISQAEEGAKTGKKNSSQIVMSSRKHRGKSYLLYAFTEQGVAMLFSVLRSERAVKVNIAIMCAFVRWREALETNRALAQKFSELEKRVGAHDDEIAAIIEAIRRLIAPPNKPPREIGFHVRETSPRYRTRSRR
jgi:hypothetical protein